MITHYQFLNISQLVITLEYTFTVERYQYVKYKNHNVAKTAIFSSLDNRIPASQNVAWQPRKKITVPQQAGLWGLTKNNKFEWCSILQHFVACHIDMLLAMQIMLKSITPRELKLAVDMLFIMLFMNLSRARFNVSKRFVVHKGHVNKRLSFELEPWITFIT